MSENHLNAEFEQLLFDIRFALRRAFFLSAADAFVQLDGSLLVTIPRERIMEVRELARKANLLSFKMGTEVFHRCRLDDCGFPFTYSDRLEEVLRAFPAFFRN